MFRALNRDLEAALRNDPAARSAWEVLLSYPGLHALALHRIAHRLWNGGQRLPARMLSHYTRFLTGIEIHPAARIAPGVFIDHGMGVVIGETAVIEEGCIIYKGVVLGGTSLERKVRHPHLEKNVIVGSNACVLGAITVGEGARIGSASVVVENVPKGATVVGVPGRIVRQRAETGGGELNHGNLPDPISDRLRQLAQQQEVILERIARLESNPSVALTSSRATEPASPAESGDLTARKRLGSIF